MRLGWIVGLMGAALTVSACDKGAEDVTANADTGLTAEAITANDVTAIDAVTGAAANMAADVDYRDLGETDGNADGNAADARPPARGEPRARPNRPASTPATEPAAIPPAEPANSTE